MAQSNAICCFILRLSWQPASHNQEYSRFKWIRLPWTNSEGRRSSSWGGRRTAARVLAPFWHLISSLLLNADLWDTADGLFLCLTSNAKFNITSLNSKNIHTQQLAASICKTSCCGGLRVCSKEYKCPDDTQNLKNLIIQSNMWSVQSCWKMFSWTNLRNYTSPNNSHSYCKSRVQYIMEPQYRNVCVESMWWTQSGILFGFLCLLKTSRHFFCVNGTFECTPYNAVLHLLRTYLTVNSVFVSSVRLFHKLNLLKLLGFTSSAVLPLDRI